MNEQQKKLLLVDGNSLFFKAYYGTAKRLEAGYERGKNGEPVNALRSFAMMILSLTKKFPTSKILIAFDAKGTKTYRTEYSFYKSGRKATPEELFVQILPSRKFLDLYGIKWTENTALEADDIIGIMAKKGKEQGNIVDIITSDKDLLQLVDENVNVHLSIKGVQKLETYTLLNFEQKVGIKSPKQLIDLKGIMGDNSDNLPGIKGIGKVGALSLIKKYGSLENVIENVDQLSPLLRKKIEDKKELALICKHLATIITDANMDFDLESLKPEKPKIAELIKFLESKNIYNIAKLIKNQ